jgi:hypothetical protein
MVPIEDPHGLKDALAAALGVMAAVQETRRLLLWRNVRIYLDEVPGLGSFIELEAVAEPGSDLSGEYRDIAELRERWPSATIRSSPTATVTSSRESAPDVTRGVGRGRGLVPWSPSRRGRGAGHGSSRQ